MIRVRRALLAVSLAAACHDAGSDGGGDSTGFGSGGAADAVDVGPNPPPADDGGSDGAPQPDEVALQVRLDLETKRDVDVLVTRTGEALAATVTVSRGYGVAADGATVTGPARIDAYPEAGATIYTARLAGDAVQGGPCGEQPVSLALALHLDDDADLLAGGLTPYCGADTWFGIPAIEPLRISGRLP